jgi:hypothetical protein
MPTDSLSAVLESLDLLGPDPLAVAGKDGWKLIPPLDELVVGLVRPAFHDNAEFAFARVSGEWRGAAVVHERDDAAMESFRLHILKLEDVPTWQWNVGPIALPGLALRVLVEAWPAGTVSPNATTLDGTRVEMQRVTADKSESLAFDTSDANYRLVAERLNALLDFMGLGSVLAP